MIGRVAGLQSSWRHCRLHDDDEMVIIVIIIIEGSIVMKWPCGGGGGAVLPLTKGPLFLSVPRMAHHRRSEQLVLFVDVDAVVITIIIIATFTLSLSRSLPALFTS